MAPSGALTKMVARQAHGFSNEKRIIEEHNLIDVSKTEGYTSKWDAIAPEALILGTQRRVTDVPTSIKTICHGNSVDMGDVFRHAKNTEDFILQVDFYVGSKKDLDIVESHKIYIDSQTWATLFKFDHYDYLRDCVRKITNHENDDPKWRNMMKKMHDLWEKPKRIVHLAPKRDHKKQKRVQCTIPNEKFYNQLLPLFPKVEYAK